MPRLALSKNWVQFSFSPSSVDKIPHRSRGRIRDSPSTGTFPAQTTPNPHFSTPNSHFSTPNSHFPPQIGFYFVDGAGFSHLHLSRRIKEIPSFFFLLQWKRILAALKEPWNLPNLPSKICCSACFQVFPIPDLFTPGIWIPARALNPKSRTECGGKKKPESVISMLWCCLIGGDYNFPSVPRGAWGGLEKLENLVASAIPGISELWDRGAAPRGVFPHSWTSLFRWKVNGRLFNMFACQGPGNI